MSMKMSLQEIKDEGLLVLNEIDRVCSLCEVNYSLAYGTLLGAVRHKGFIPWDDDVDIMMCRNDYEKFIEYCTNNETSFKLLCSKTEKNYSYLFAKACSKNTHIDEINGNRKNIEYGVYVDIFPIDNLGNTQDEAEKNLKKMQLFRSIIVCSDWKHFFRSKTKAWYYEPIRFAFYAVSRIVSINKYKEKVENFYTLNFENKATYVGNSVDATYGAKEIVKCEFFDEYTMLEFEGYEFKCIKEYSQWLSAIYNNYMQLPSKDKQVTHHTFEAYYL